MSFTPVILVHVLAAFSAVSIGGVMFWIKKGTTTHRLLGRIWMLLMLVAALISFAIKTSGHFSWIHLLSIWFLFTMSMALWSIYRRNIKAHQRWVVGSYVGLVGAGVFTLLPFRLLGQLVWGSVGLN